MGPLIRDNLRRLTVLGALVCAGQPVSAQAGVNPVDPDDFELYTFSIYNTQVAKELAAYADEHLAAGRYAEAMVALQQLLDEHKGEVLGGRRINIGDMDRKSQQPVHEGASEFATRRLFELAPSERALYRERYGERARVDLHTAIQSADRAGLTALARRYPLTEEATRAWFALGDLEVELGNVQDGVRAWGRGVAWKLGDPRLTLTNTDDWDAALARLQVEAEATTLQGLRARATIAQEVLNGGGGLGSSGMDTRGSTAIEPRSPFLAPPGDDPDTWNEAFTLPSHPFNKTHGSTFPLFATRADDTIFVSTSLEVIAIGAYTGEVIWQGDRPPGWDRVSSKPFFQAVDTRASLIAPATGQGVVVAALQIPLALDDPYNYGQMEVITAIPNRRLFAYDAATGRPLWNTLPPPMWDGESGDFKDRMRIVGPPVIAGSRVFVPCARLRGRIEFHVACLDLLRGNLLWSTALITGQRELNMFGRKVTDFCAPPLTVAGNKVIALTQLGSIAALDLFTGDVLWETLYETIELRPLRSYQARRFNNKWRNAPAVIAGDYIIAAPYDSSDLVGLDSETGALAWSQSHDRINRLISQTLISNYGLDLLVGGDDKRVYLGGNKVAAFRISDGYLGKVEWVYPPKEKLQGLNPRPVVGAESILIPDKAHIATVDRDSGMLKGKVEWRAGGQGNLLVCDGMMFALSGRRLGSYFQWEKLVDRARAALRDSPQDIDRGLSLAALLEKRGTGEWTAGRLENARRHLSEARATLVGIAGGKIEQADPRIQRKLHGVLRVEARVYSYQGNPNAALNNLSLARDLAPTTADLCHTLLEHQELLRSRNETQWLETLQLLREECADVEILCDSSPTGEGEYWARDLQPVVGTSEGGLRKNRLPAGLWVLLERAEAHGRKGRSREEFADLHSILADYSMVSFEDDSPADWAAERIASKLTRGETRGYEVFESKAQEMLDTAISRGDARALERIPRLFPHSTAARSANDERLALAVTDGDVATVIEIVSSELSSGGSSALNEREARYMLRLASVIGHNGNARMRSALLSRLSATHGWLRSDVEGDDGLTIKELAARHAVLAEETTLAEEATFDKAIRKTGEYLGNFRYLGEIQRGVNDRDRVLLFGESDGFQAFADTDLSEPIWYESIDASERTRRNWKKRFISVPGLAVIATEGVVVALDRTTGQEMWTWSGDGDSVETIKESDGVVIATLKYEEDIGQHSSNVRNFGVVGLDSATGTELWRLRVDAREYERNIICGEGRMAFLPGGSPFRRGVIYDLYTCRRLAQFELELLRSKSAGAAWIEGGRLIVPRLRQSLAPDRNHVIAFELDSGQEAWRVEFSSGRFAGMMLDSIISYADQTFLLLRPPPKEKSRAVALYKLNVRRGSIDATPVTEMAREARLIGIHQEERTIVQTPYLFVFGHPRPNGNLTIRAIHLPYGQRWEFELPLSADDPYTLSMPLPAMSDTTVAFSWRVKQLNSQFQNKLLFLDRASGLRRDERTLARAFDSHREQIELVPLGKALIVTGANTLHILEVTK